MNNVSVVFNPQAAAPFNGENILGHLVETKIRKIGDKFLVTPVIKIADGQTGTVQHANDADTQIDISILTGRTLESSRPLWFNPNDASKNGVYYKVLKDLGIEFEDLGGGNVDLKLVDRMDLYGTPVIFTAKKLDTQYNKGVFVTYFELDPNGDHILPGGITIESTEELDKDAEGAF